MSLSQSAKNTVDPLSDVLAALGAQGVRGTRLEASGDWALSFQGQGRLKFVAVVQGRCWLLLPDRPPETLAQGNVFLLSNTRFTVASDPTITPVDGMPFFDGLGQDLVRLGQRADTVMIGGGSRFAGGRAGFILEALPAFLRIDQSSPRAGAVSRILASLEAEVGDAYLGGSLVTQRLAEILMIEAIRAYADASSMHRVSWIAALADAKIGAALRLMHADVARPWTAAALAAEVGMSRSAFTQRFSARVGKPPLDYLIGWRMTLAQSRLNSRTASIASVAAEVGYSSQSAFAQAFKRSFGVTPRSILAGKLNPEGTTDFIPRS